jgi:predicted nucleotidyltransferase
MLIPNVLRDITEQYYPLYRKKYPGKIAFAVSGSVGRGNFSPGSDIDLRIYYENTAADPETVKEIDTKINQADQWFADRGVTIDDCWPRKIKVVTDQLTSLISGESVEQNLVWTVWGYHLLSDIKNQKILRDEYGVIKEWQKFLDPYPKKLKNRILRENQVLLSYWKNDYHFKKKAKKKDIVFVSGLLNKLVHGVIRVLFAVNDEYFPGDGYNLDYVQRFKKGPENGAEQIEAILTGISAENLEEKRNLMIDLIQEIENEFK